MKQKYVRKLTLWHPGTNKPVNPGPYQVSPRKDGTYRRADKEVLYSNWDGSVWGMVAFTVDAALKYVDPATGRNKTQCSAQNLAWRGRTSP